MKKLLTIVALALVLCLSISAALALTYDQLDAKQKADIVDKLVKAGTLKDSTEIEAQKTKLTFKEGSGSVSWSFEGSDAKGTVLGCEDGAHTYGASTYTYYEWDAAKKAVAEKATESTTKPANVMAYTHYGDVCEVKVCTICGSKDTKVLAKKVDHHFSADYTYSTTDPSKEAAKDVTIADKDELKAWPCQAANKGLNLFKYRKCDDCQFVESAQVYEKVDGKHKAGAEEVLTASTCMTHGQKGKKCTQCGTVVEITDPKLPLAAHTYTEKHYSPKMPNCKTGLVFVYTYECKWFAECGQYEGDLTKPDYDKYGHKETMTLEKAAEKLGWNEEVNGTKLYDADGHHYILEVKPETGAATYGCETGYKWTYACEFCGKKLVITNGEEKPEYEKKNVDDSKTEFVNCLTIKVTYKCDYCDGKVAGHTKTEEVTLKNDDAQAHNNGKYFVEDLTKRVEPTCSKAGKQVLVCQKCNYVKEVKLDKLPAHSWGAYVLVKVNEKDPGNEYVWERSCVFCGETDKIVTTETKDAPKADSWVKTDDKSDGTCIEASYVVYKHVDKDGKDIKVDDKVETKKVYGPYGSHVLAKVENYKDAQSATCSKPGIELWICTRCTKYDPDTPKAKELQDCMTYLGKLEGGTPYYKVVETDKLAHTWGTPVVVEATAEKDGSITKTCTVCGEVEVTTVPFEKADAEYELADVKFDGELLTGKLVHKAGTKDADKLSVRVTFFTAGNNYMVTAAVIYEDGTFEAEGAGVIEHITVGAYSTDKVVNPASLDPEVVTCFGTTEIDVK